MTTYKTINATALVDNVTGMPVGLLGADGKEYFFQATAFDNDSAYLYKVPTTGFNITVPGETTRVILDPAGTLAAGTLTLKSGLVDGQVLTISANQTITALTISGSGCTLGNGMPTTIAPATGAIAFLWRAASNKWFRTR